MYWDQAYDSESRGQHACVSQARSQKIHLGGSFGRKVDLMHHPTAAKENSALLYRVCITHIHEGVISAPFIGALQNIH